MFLKKKNNKKQIKFILVAGKRTTIHSCVFTADLNLDTMSTFFATEDIFPELNTSYKIPTCFFWQVKSAWEKKHSTGKKQVLIQYLLIKILIHAAFSG